MTAGVPAGRPRDPGVDERITRAAALVYGTDGWAGFSVDAVARKAGVGKASIYLRWPNKEALFVATLASRLGGVRDIDTGSVRDDLVALARQVLATFLGEDGGAVLRLTVEAGGIPAGREHLDRFLRSQVAAARAIVLRGIDRGQLSRDTSVTLLLDCISGGALNHAVATPADLRAQVAAGADRYAEELVDFVLSSSYRVPR
ncbi:AcrR family transcriptional regulator [Actinoplanes campanulatus]|uniref:AcrR family transcriptional regulator n=1 Tax=Actinoplanes campanulatus TaxID=113559 RepID=A0A7W5AEX6_9ACTN|nr:TetR/AcrR family transcriptional regulator [Actinoplanes campanulatus]MBB3095072.1 AcrR family transcriptional regulator [Actinoplanes campanulatus]GGN23240.1 putative TetR-family transcriptional regulator [Actinoplanes campanulatus]GID34676.1 putative TetR-family transcriptional regulator [Actinoplanes campanulatus]